MCECADWYICILQLCMYPIPVLPPPGGVACPSEKNAQKLAFLSVDKAQLVQFPRLRCRAGGLKTWSILLVLGWTCHSTRGWKYGYRVHVARHRHLRPERCITHLFRKHVLPSRFVAIRRHASKLYSYYQVTRYYGSNRVCRSHPDVSRPAGGAGPRRVLGAARL